MKIQTLKKSAKIAAAFAVLSLLAPSLTAQAAEVKLFAGGGFKSAATALAPEFERATGNRLVSTFDSAGGFQKRVQNGESFDVLLIGPALVDPLIKQGKIVAATRADVARAGLGVAVKAGAPKPDVGTVEAFKSALLNAKAVAYVGDGHSGEYFRAMLDRMGIADQMKPKLKPLGTAKVTAAVTDGDADLAIWVIPGLVANRGLALAGAVPAALQDYVNLTAGLSATAPDPEGGKALIKFLTSPSAATVMKSKGWQPAPY